MSTRANITALCSDGYYRSVYLHSDGYIDHAYHMLVTHYTTQEKIDALMALGDLSQLHASPEAPEGHSFNTPVRGHCVAYHRDRQEPLNLGLSTSALVARMNGGGSQEYNYLWDGKSWSVI